MEPKFKLQFLIKQIEKYSKDYPWGKLEPRIINEIVPSVNQKGFLTKEEFLIVFNWKSPRPIKHAEKNDESFIKEITQLSLSTSNEQLRILSLTLLQGVNFPVASVFFHFFHNDKYPIIDWRALESLEYDPNNLPPYDFRFWFAYAEFCRNISLKTDKTMREVDRALWSFSKQKVRTN